MVVVTKSCWQQSLFICQLTNTDNCGRTKEPRNNHFSFLILRILDNLCFITHNTVLHGEYLFIKLTNYPPSKLADILFL